MSPKYKVKTVVVDYVNALGESGEQWFTYRDNAELVAFLAGLVEAKAKITDFGSYE